VVGLIFLVARIWDAVNDPMMGVVIDHTRSKHGKSRVYLRYASLPLAAATILLFHVPAFGAAGRIAYAAVTYILWGMLYTMVNIPYSSMTAELTGDPEERTSLSAVRMLFMLAGVVVVSVATEPLVARFPSKGAGYFWTAVIYAAVAFIFFQLCFAATGKAAHGAPRVREPGDDTAEGARTAAPQGYTRKEALPIVAKNTQLLILAAAFLVGATAEYIREASVIYFVTYNMGDGSLLPVFMGVVVLSMIAGNLVIPATTRRLDKRGTYMAGAAIAIVGSILFHFIPHDNLTLVLAVAALSSFGFTVVSTLGWAMLPDTVEYGQAVTGVRTEGVIYSFFSFSQKLATAIAGALAALTLQLTGYVPNAPLQTPRALSGILSTLTFIPVVLIALSAVILRFYTLDRKRFSEIQARLAEPKA
jgi:sugar (glycoside-pentoside-hexuronide) transporter